VRVHALIAGYAFRRYSTYRGAMIGGIVANTVFGFIQVAILIAVWKQNPSGIGGYDVTDAVTYVFIAQALIGPMASFGGGLDLSERIRTGDVATDLFRPVDFQLYWLSQDLGRAGFLFIGRGIVPSLAGLLAFRLYIPQNPLTWAALAVAIFLGLLVSFALRYLVALTAFWLLDERGVASLMTTATSFFSGLLLPLVLFPGWLGSLARALPWSAMVQVPAEIYLGKVDGSVWTAYAFALTWAVALLGLGRVVGDRARRKVVSQGG
jgi:ABC-2 type transport system permease protein